MSPDELTTALKTEAIRLGFDAAGAAPAVVPPSLDHFRNWIDDGFAAQMGYMAERLDAYGHPRYVLDGVRGILMLTVDYRTDEPAEADSGSGLVSRYAWGTDYHDVIRERLHDLADFHRRLVPGADVRGVVDTAPLLEREFARLAGLGWVGKNTMLINEASGSWFFLAALLTTEQLAEDAPVETDRCGSCRACIDACPTGALVAPHRLDARRCISYLSVESQDQIPPEFRRPMGNRLFGCDACQNACPWNRRRQTDSETNAPVTDRKTFRPGPGMNPVDPAALFDLDEAAFRRRFRHTPFWRARRRGILRNAAIVLGNSMVTNNIAENNNDAVLSALQRGLEDAEPQVRAACAWALGRFGREDETAE